MAGRHAFSRRGELGQGARGLRKNFWERAAHEPTAHPQSLKRRVGRALPAAKHRLIGVEAL